MAQLTHFCLPTLLFCPQVNSLPAERIQEIQKAIELFSVGQGPAKTMEEASKRSYQFWDTQPVPKLGMYSPPMSCGPWGRPGGPQAAPGSPQRSLEMLICGHQVIPAWPGLQRHQNYFSTIQQPGLSGWGGSEELCKHFRGTRNHFTHLTRCLLLLCIP